MNSAPMPDSTAEPRAYCKACDRRHPPGEHTTTDERGAGTFDLPCALCDGRGWIDNLYAPCAGKSRGGPCPRCDEGVVTVAVTAQMVEAAIDAGPNGIEGCEYAPGQFCGGTHTDCYFRGIVEAALGAAYNEPLAIEPRGATDAF